MHLNKENDLIKAKQLSKPVNRQKNTKKNFTIEVLITLIDYVLERITHLTRKMYFCLSLGLAESTDSFIRHL